MESRVNQSEGWWREQMEALVPAVCSMVTDVKSEQAGGVVNEHVKSLWFIRSQVLINATASNWSICWSHRRHSGIFLNHNN